MAGNPAQADHTIPEVPEDSTDLRIQNLEREVDLIKTSIKRLLMDIRERMNELENPFTVATGPVARGNPTDADELKKADLDAKEAALNAREAHLNASIEKTAAPAPVPSPVGNGQNLPPSAGEDRRVVDEQLLAQYKARAPGVRGPAGIYGEKFRLQKVYKLFKWTSQAVKKYGHDRLEIILQSYKTMGYISKDSSDEIREIAKLMPASLGEEHEVGPDEYVSELYTLNRIIAPEDTSLDRDMIEVMMEQRSQQVQVGIPSPGRTIEFPTVPAKEKKISKNQDMDEDWMNLPDRI
ncbi:MAG: hypothetical protein NTY71_04490 [Methanoregula sp.]|nr:hypothetical protein [Methanoregula sp.]